MLIIGLTGSVGMGKTTAGRYLAQRGVAVFDADEAVHDLYRGAAAGVIGGAFPGALVEGRIDRGRLAQAVIGFPEQLARLEAIVHPLVRDAEWRFLKERREAGARMAALDIPLLFETGAEAMMDATIVLTAPPEIQHGRVMRRPGMTEQKLRAMLARQAPDAEKRARADFVVDTSGPLASTRKKLDEIIEALSHRSGAAYDRWRALYEPEGVA